MLSLIINFLFDRENEKLMFRSAIALYIAILALGSVPGVRAEMNHVAPGLVLHFLAYSCIALGLFCGYAGTPARKVRMTLASVVVMGAFDELLQSFFPYRRGAVEDWIVDVLAAMTTVAICWMISVRRARSLPVR